MHNISIESRFYRPSLVAPYTNSLQIKIQPNFAYQGHYLPTVLLTAMYQVHPRTGILLGVPKLIAHPHEETDGRLDTGFLPITQEIKLDYLYDCMLSLRVIYNEGIVNKIGLSVGGEVGAEKVAKAGANFNAESGQDRPAKLFFANYRVHVHLNARAHTLEAHNLLIY